MNKFEQKSNYQFCVNREGDIKIQVIRPNRKVTIGYAGEKRRLARTVVGMNNAHFQGVIADRYYLLHTGD